MIITLKTTCSIVFVLCLNLLEVQSDNLGDKTDSKYSLETTREPNKSSSQVRSELLDGAVEQVAGRHSGVSSFEKALPSQTKKIESNLDILNWFVQNLSDPAIKVAVIMFICLFYFAIIQLIFVDGKSNHHNALTITAKTGFKNDLKILSSEFRSINRMLGVSMLHTSAGKLEGDEEIAKIIEQAEQVSSSELGEYLFQLESQLIQHVKPDDTRLVNTSNLNSSDVCKIDKQIIISKVESAKKQVLLVKKKFSSGAYSRGNSIAELLERTKPNMLNRIFVLLAILIVSFFTYLFLFDYPMQTLAIVFSVIVLINIFSPT